MRLRLARPSRGALIEAAPFVVVLAAAVYVYTRFHSSLQLTRDEGIYVYSAVRLAHGVPPYQSIWDPKTPGTSMLGALSIKFGHVVGLHALDAIRFVFFGTAVLTALSVYLLGRVLWKSIPPGLIGAGVFLCFESWAFEAPSGPDAKMPGIFLVVLSMALVIRRRWILAGLASALGFLFWQPLLVFVATAGIAALLVPGRRARWTATGMTAIGAAVPIGATCIYFAVVGAFRDFIDAAFVQPATGAQPFPGFGPSLQLIQLIVTKFELFNMWTLWIGIGAVLVCVALRLVSGRRALLDAVRDPLVSVVGLSLVVVLAFSVRDFQNYPDLDPLLPFAGLGFGGVYVLIRNAATRMSDAAPLRLGVPVVCGLATIGLLTASVIGFSTFNEQTHPTLHIQRAQACAINEIAGRHNIWSFGDTASLVLAHRTNPDNFVYFGGGVLEWKLNHLKGGLSGWKRQIRAAHPAVLEINQWRTPERPIITTWLKRYYHATYLGGLRVFLTPAARVRARALGIYVSPTRISFLRDDQPELVKRVGTRCA